MERRESRLRRIRAKLSANESQVEPVADTPQEHHHIGISQNQYEDIGIFLRTNAGDPAINVRAYFKWKAFFPDAL
jgi:hypothetical protein